MSTIDTKFRRRQVFRLGVGKSLRLGVEARRQSGEISRDAFELARDRVVRMSCCSVIWGCSVWDDGAEYPPGLPPNPKHPRATLMRYCFGCHRWIPPEMNRRLHCYDCYLSELPDGTFEEPGMVHRTPSSNSIISVYALPHGERNIARKSGRLPDDVRADWRAAEDSGSTGQPRKRRRFKAATDGKSPAAIAWVAWKSAGGGHAEFVAGAAEGGYDPHLTADDQAQ